jgi:hypothetical protein
MTGVHKSRDFLYSGRDTKIDCVTVEYLKQGRTVFPILEMYKFYHPDLLP